ATNRTVAAAAGRLLGRFHGALAGLDPSTFAVTLPPFHDPARRLDALRAAVAADVHDRASTVTAEIDAALAGAPLADRARDDARELPLRVAHGDAKLDNMLF